MKLAKAPERKPRDMNRLKLMIGDFTLLSTMYRDTKEITDMIKNKGLK